MTRIAERKTSMEGETAARYRGRPLIVTITPHDVILRERKRPRRMGIAVPWLMVYELGMKLAAAEARRQRLEKRRGG